MSMTSQELIKKPKMFVGYKTRNWIFLLLRGRETIAERRKTSNYTSQSGSKSVQRGQNNLISPPKVTPKQKQKTDRLMKEDDINLK